MNQKSHLIVIISVLYNERVIAGTKENGIICKERNLGKGFMRLTQKLQSRDWGATHSLPRDRAPT